MAATYLEEEVLAEYAINTIMENAMPTRNVVLTDSQAQFGEQMVQAGRYKNASEVMREAVAAGMADIEAGRYTEFADAASLRSHITALSKRVLAKHG